MDNSNYPLMSQSDWDNAPWNQADKAEKEVEVTVSITLSKTVKIKVSDYNLIDFGKDEDGEYFEEVDYSDCDLKRAVQEQIVLPQEAYKHVESPIIRNDLNNWCVDDFEINLEQ